MGSTEHETYRSGLAIALADIERSKAAINRTVTGRTGEELTIRYEKARTKAEPKWEAIESNLAGYDIESRISVDNSDSLLIDVLSGSCLKTELRRESLPLLAFAHSQKSYIQSSWRLKGDSGLIVRSLVDDIKRMGGDVVCRAEVTELIEHEGRIVAALTANGERYEADSFISDIHPAQTFALVKDSKVLKKIFRTRMSMLANTYGMYTYSLVLKPHALSYFNHNKFVYEGGSVWDEPTAKVMLSCRVPEDGKEDNLLLDLLTPCEGHPMALAEKAVPGLRDMVEQQYVSTPHTWQRFTRTPEGSAYGVRKDCRQPLLTMLSPRTPLSNLLLTGQNVMLHGLEGVVMTAQQTCDIILN